MKLAVVGAGSFVFAPSVLKDAIEKHRMTPCELVLMDLDLEAAEIMAGIGRRMADELRTGATVRATDNRRRALEGCDFVILCASPEGARRWKMDYEILERHGMGDQSRECGGLGGLSNSLRSIGLAMAVARDMEELCPGAALLDVTNPMPRVVTAASRHSSIRAYGFCNLADGGPAGHEWLPRLLGREPQSMEVVTAGLNHFAWLVSARDRATGADLMDEAEAAVRKGAGREFTLLQRWLDKYGAIAAGHPDHTAEYLAPDPDVRYCTQPPYHGGPEERKTRREQLRATAAGALDWRETLTGGSWEHPVDLAAAAHFGLDRCLGVVNLPNDHYVPELPAGRIVEVPTVVTGGEVHGAPIDRMPGTTGELCRTVSDVHELVAEGAATGSIAKLEEAIEADPAIPDKPRGRRALGELIAAHADIEGWAFT